MPDRLPGHVPGKIQRRSVDLRILNASSGRTDHLAFLLGNDGKELSVLFMNLVN